VAGGDRIKDTCTLFIAAYLPLSLTTAIPLAESDTSVSDHDFESSLGESPGTKTPAGMVCGPYQLPRPPERNRLSDDIMEAIECLKA